MAVNKNACTNQEMLPADHFCLSAKASSFPIGPPAIPALPSGQGEENALRQELANHPARCCANGQPDQNSDLSLAAGSPSQHQIGHVDRMQSPEPVARPSSVNNNKGSRKSPRKSEKPPPPSLTIIFALFQIVQISFARLRAKRPVDELLQDNILHVGTRLHPRWYQTSGRAITWIHEALYSSSHFLPVMTCSCMVTGIESLEVSDYIPIKTWRSQQRRR